MRPVSLALRFARLGCGVGILTAAFAATASAQSPKSEPPTERAPLARYVPKENLVGYAEFDGLDAHTAAWQKTSAYRLLNETSLGVMLEDVGAQAADFLLQRSSDRRISGAETVTIAKYLARNGWLFASTHGANDPKDSCMVLIVRGGAKKEVRGLFSRLMLTVGGSQAKPGLVKGRRGRAVVKMSKSKPGDSWAWWVEGNDLLIALDRPQSADIVGDVLDGGRPSAVDHPVRTTIQNTEGSFEPVAWAFIDSALWPDSSSNEFFRTAQLRGVERLDYRWGFSDDALMSVTRIQAAKPRQGLLAAFDQPTFDKSSFPVMPKGLEAFQVLSIDLAKTYDVLASAAHAAGPAAGQAFDKAVATFRTRTRLQLRKDVLAHIGPKIAVYIAPVATSSKKRQTEKAAAPETPAPGRTFNPLAMLGIAQTPRYTMTVGIDDPAAFSRSLESLMILVNQQIRTIGKPSLPAGPPGEGAGAADAAPGSRRRGGDEGPAPQFKMTAGLATSYVLDVPTELGRLPAGIRPSIQLGKDQLAVSVAPDAARRALELKPNEVWTPSAEQAPAIDALPQDLIFLKLNDPRTKLSQLLANFPEELQQTVNMVLAVAMPPQLTGAIASPAPGSALPGGAGGTMPGSPGGMQQPRVRAMEVLQIKVDAAKRPQADALKSLIFPGTVAVAEDDQGIRLVVRQAFPDPLGPLNWRNLMLVLPAIQKGREAAQKAAAGRPASPTGPGAPAAKPGAAAPPGPAGPGGGTSPPR